MKLVKPDICVTADCSILDALKAIEHNGKEIILAVDARGALVATITDGDLRRALLNGLGLDAKLGAVCELRQQTVQRAPITARENTPRGELLSLMRAHKIRHIPLLDAAGVVKNLVTLDDLLMPEPIACSALILAGGKGLRLRPLTEHTPKPMLPVQGRPVIQIIVDQLIASGIRRIYIASHYQAGLLESYFKDRAQDGVEIECVVEEQPLGTGGALGLLPKLAEPILVINGDILCKVNFQDIYAQHLRQQAFLTVGIKSYRQQVPYGVVQVENGQVRSIEEKPAHSALINAGIYLASPAVQRYAAKGKEINMTDIVALALRDKEKVASFEIQDLWLDIGSLQDLAQAQNYPDRGA